MHSADASADNEVCAILSSPKYVVKPQPRPGGVGDKARIGPASPRANGSHVGVGMLGATTAGVAGAGGAGSGVGGSGNRDMV
ncbi:unnamed protein product, partial [Discosporangium mesarthrocarpum]